MAYDVIIVGARVAGSATALLLARQGARVLLLDQARFPSDTLSTHQVQVPAVARLRRWGLLEAVEASNAVPARTVRFDPGPVVLHGSFPAHEGVDALYSPRRYILDQILLDAACEAGAEVVERFTVEDLLRDGGPVVGITGRAKGGAARSERATLVIGADGKHSTVARLVGAQTKRSTQALSGAVYTYWSGLPVSGGEMYSRRHRAIGVWPTNDGLVMTYIAVPGGEFGEFHRDLEANVLSTFDAAGDLGERARDAVRAERFRSTPDLPNRVRVSHGDGWALVGDAGLVMDPITGRGIDHGLRDAELAARAVTDGLSGQQSMRRALAGYERERDRATLPMYKFTLQSASLTPSTAADALLFHSLDGRQEEIDRFLGVLTGTEPLTDCMTPGNLHRLVGSRGLLTLMRSRGRQRHATRHQSAA
jgi:flavin-dependent dehydrogenase